MFCLAICSRSIWGVDDISVINSVTLFCDSSWEKAVNSAELTSQPVGCPVLCHCEEEVIATALLIVNMTTCVACITHFDQWATFNDVTYQNILRNSTCCGGRDTIRSVSLCVEWYVTCLMVVTRLRLVTPRVYQPPVVYLSHTLGTFFLADVKTTSNGLSPFKKIQSKWSIDTLT